MQLEAEGKFTYVIIAWVRDGSVCLTFYQARNSTDEEKTGKTGLVTLIYKRHWGKIIYFFKRQIKKVEDEC